jgi:hypothetical protein
MNIINQKALNLLNILYYKLFKPKYAFQGRSKLINNIEYGNKIIKEALLNEKPIMIARIGTTECGTLLNYLGVRDGFKNIWKYISWRQPAWWWNGTAKKSMSLNSGFFPTTDYNLNKFGQLMLDDIREADILASITNSEQYLKKYFSQAKRISIASMEPYFSINPWTDALKGKKILVVHPMVETFQKQWKVIDKIWPDGMIPDFELLTFKAVQTIAGEKTEFKDWFEALELMKSEISKIEFDISIIGCGAYGFPLAAHVKRMGKKAIHMGGSTQLLFGVKGKRWESNQSQPFNNFMNEYWVRPAQSETPQNSDLVENSCYW